MIADNFFFNDREEIGLAGVVFNIKTRLTKYVHKKTGKFLYWSIDVKETISDKTTEENLTRYKSMYIVTADSGVFDYTEDGSFFGLTETQRERALEKRITQ